MAGTDQSVNLGGMLNNIAGTIGEGYQIGGKSAGEAMGGLIANSVKPTLDMNDPASLKNYARWARNNGREEEAMRYEAESARLRKQQQSLQAMAQAGEVSNKAISATQGGDLTQLEMQRQEAVKGIQTAMANNDVDGARQWQQTLQQLRTMGTAAQEQATKNKATNIGRINSIIKGGVDGEGNALPQQAIDAMKVKRAELMEDAEAVSIYNKGLMEERRNLAFEEEEANKAAVAAFLKEAGSLNDPAAIEEAFGNVDEAAAPAVLAMKSTLVRDAEDRIRRSEEAAAKQTQLASVDVVEAWQARIDAMPEDAVQARKMAQATLDAAKKKDDSLFVNKTYTGAGRKSAEAAWNKADTTLSQIMVSSAAASDGVERTKRKQNEDRLLELEMQRAVPASAAEINRVRGYTADKDGNPTISEAKAADLIEAERQAEYRELQAVLDPEGAAAFQKQIADGYLETWSADQRQVVDDIIKINPKVKELLAAEGGEELAKRLVEAGHTKWLKASTAAEVPESQKGNGSGLNVFGLDITGIWEVISDDTESRRANTRRRQQSPN